MDIESFKTARIVKKINQSEIQYFFAIFILGFIFFAKANTILLIFKATRNRRKRSKHGSKERDFGALSLRTGNCHAGIKLENVKEDKLLN